MKKILLFLSILCSISTFAQAEFPEGIDLGGNASTANSTKGFILKNGQPFIHNFYAGTNPITGGTGNNINIGVNSGNFNADNFNYASTMVGFESGLSNKNGYSNTGIGYYALKLNENGYGNTALGTLVLGNAINSYQNTSVGWHSMLYRTGGSSNTGFGVDVLKENLEGSFNTAFGTNAGANNVVGNLNLFLGYAAGFNELGSSKLYISNSSTADPLIKGDFSTNSLSLGGGVGNKVDIYGVGSNIKTDYKTHANALTPIIYDASNYTFNLNTSGAFTINSTGVAVGLTSGNINKFEVLTASSTGSSSANGIAVHDGMANRMALLSGVNTASSYSWIQSAKGGVGVRPIFLNPNGGGVSIGNTTDAGTGNINIAGKATAGSPASVANDLMRKGETDTALSLKANLASPALTGTPTAPTATAGTNTTQLATTAFVTEAVTTAASSGSYTPTATNVANVSSFQSNLGSRYTKIGNIVTITINIPITATANSTLTQASFTLPSGLNNIGTLGVLLGTAQSIGNGVIIHGEVISLSSTTVRLDYTSLNTSTQNFHISFSYQTN